MAEFTAPSGAKVVINAAPFQDVMKLKRAMERESALIGGGLNLQTLLIVDGSDSVDALLWPCLARSLYNDEKITPSTFDAIDRRQDYYEVVAVFLKENIAPLAEGLRSKLTEFGLLKAQASTAASQNSEATTNAAS